jgi:hypothetical protein
MIYVEGEITREVSIMKPRILVVPVLLSVCLSHAAWSADNVTYSKVYWSGATAHVVSINLNSPDMKVTVSLARRGRGSSESFSSMVHRVKPAAAITGTFFCTRSLLPTGDIVVEGSRIHTGCVGTGVCITPDNKVDFVPYSTGHKRQWQGYDTVLCAGPTLVRDGQMYLMPRDQGFHDPSLFGAKRRTAVGVTAGNKLLLVAVDTPVQLRKLANIMMHLGAVNAVDLDGGSSTALHCNGQTVSRPGRSLTNLLVVYSSLTDYYHYREALVPGIRPVQVASERVRPAQPAGALMGMKLPTDQPALPTSVVLTSGQSIARYPETVAVSLRGGASPAAGSEHREPVLPDADTAVITAAKTETSLTSLTIKQTRRTQREHSLMISSRLLVH